MREKFFAYNMRIFCVGQRRGGQKQLNRKIVLNTIKNIGVLAGFLLLTLRRITQVISRQSLPRAGK